MGLLRQWQNTPVKIKLFSLALLPLAGLCTLSTKFIIDLNEQTDHLSTANKLIDYKIDVYEVFSNPSSYYNGNNPLSNASQDLTPLSNKLDPFVSDFIDATEEANLAGDYHDKFDASEWKAETFQELMLSLEDVDIQFANDEIKKEIVAATNLVWLMFWANEETRLAKSLIQEYQEHNEYNTELVESIHSLSSNQSLFLKRFIALNASEKQIETMSTVFGDESFALTQEFREELHNMESLKALTQTDIKAGLLALEKRLTILTEVTHKIEKTLVNKIHDNIDSTNNDKQVFLGSLSLGILLIIYLTYVNANSIIRKLNVILDFLAKKHPDANSNSKISKLATSKDELGHFADKVQKLTIDRTNAQDRMLKAKLEAEKEKENAIKASKAKSSFLANMSHEIRTPLNGVIGMSDVLNETNLSATQSDYVDTIQTSSHLLLSLINDILDLSKIESGMLLISPHTTSIRETIYDIAAIIAPKAKEKGLSLVADIQPDTPARVMVDDHRLRQVLMNFISNAVKFTEKGNVALSISTNYKDNGTADVTFGVQDSGIGIDEDKQKAIFNPFTQEDDSTTREFGGTGLGLTISTQLIELMGSQIELTSTKGEGSRFFFTLNLKVIEQELKSKDTNSTVLICDDSSTTTLISNELAFHRVELNATYLSTDEVLKLNTIPAKALFVETNPNHAIDKESQLKSLKDSGCSICLVRHSNNIPHDFKDNISSLVTLPILGERLIKAINAKPPTHQPTHTPDLTQTSKHRVLIVDDNAINTKLASLHIKKLGIPYDTAENGEVAVNKTAETQYDLILMDCRMPVMDGFDATIEIRKLETQNNVNPTHIIALTASIIDDDIQKCFDVGMNDYLAKPINSRLLKEKINKALGSQNLITPTPIKTNKEETTEPNTNNGPLALLAEDNKVNQKVASLMLKKANIRFDIADNGQIALDKFKTTKYDIVVMDCMMPVMDGFSATEAIRQYEKDSSLNKTPIIALTASVIDDDIQKCFNSGMDAYIPKPVKKDKLISQINRLIQEAQ